MTAERTKIGLCGLGNMGLAVAGRLATAYHVIAFDPSKDRRQLAAATEHIEPVPSLKPLSVAETVVLSLPTPAVSRQVCTELAGILKPGSLVLETSTTTPDGIRDCAVLLEPTGISILDAAILSGVGQMESGTATLLVGGSDEDIARAGDILDVLAADIRRFGGPGTGMAAKVVNNAVAHAVMVVLTEAASMAAASGVDLEKITDMLRAPDGGLIRPLTHRLEERIANGNYDGGMPLDAARKDSILAMDMAQSLGVPLFAIQAAHTVYDLALSQGLGRRDYSALATLWEDWTGNSLRYRGGEHA